MSLDQRTSQKAEETEYPREVPAERTQQQMDAHEKEDTRSFLRGQARDGRRPQVRCLAAHSDRPDELAGAWDDALASDRPEVPPLPPHIRFEQVRNISSALLEGDPHERRVIGGTVRQLVSALMPSKT